MNPNTSTEKRQWGRSLAAIRYCYWLRAAPSALPRDGSQEKNHICVTPCFPLKRRLVLHHHLPSLALGLQGAEADATKREERARHRTAFHGFSALMNNQILV